MRIRAWRVHDTGLVAAPGRFRRLTGAVRHHQGRGEPWPAEICLEIVDDALVVDGVGRWPLAEVSATVVGQGPPVTFVVRIPDGDHLLAAAAGPATAELLDALAAYRGPT